MIALGGFLERGISRGTRNQALWLLVTTTGLLVSPFILLQGCCLGGRVFGPSGYHTHPNDERKIENFLYTLFYVFTQPTLTV